MLNYKETELLSKVKPNLTKQNVQGAIGALTGIFVSSLFQPLQVVKIGLIMTPNLPTNFAARINIVTSNIIKNYSWRGFWNGLTPATIKNSLGSSFYFYLLKNIQKKSQQSKLKFASFWSSATARMISSILINPFTVLQTRCLVPGAKQYSGILESILKINRNQGFHTFFKGTLPVCYKQGLFAGIYYALYQNIKPQKESTILNSLFFGLISGIIATAVTHPFEILRAQIQSGINFKYLGILDGMNKIYELQGFRGFIKGLVPRLARKPLINSSTFLIYDLIEKNMFRYIKE